MIEIKNVSKYFDNFTALDDVSISIKKGTIHGLIGENGAGKTTLIQALVGIYTVDEGEILVDGKIVYDNNYVKKDIAYVADRNQFFPNYKIKELVGFFDSIYSTFSKESFDKYNKVLKLDVNRKVKQLSKGMQMRLSLMLNLAIHPKVLVLDEPTSGLDAIVKKDILDILIEEVLESNMTVVISSHHISELEKICDEVTIINHGKVAYQSSVDELKQDIKKLQVVFKDNVPKEINELENIISIENIGSVYYIVTNKYTKEFENKLKSLGAMLVEPIGITLEEIFVYTSKAREGRGVQIEDK